MGGGLRILDIDANTIHIYHQTDTFFVYRGRHQKMTIHVDKNGKKRVSLNYSNWLPSGVSIATSTWATQDNTNSLTLADSAADTTTTETYVTATTRDTELYIENKIVTDATVPETMTTSVLIKCSRVVGV